MKNPKIPDHYQTVMPYIVVEKASAFLSFTKAVFHAKEKIIRMRDEHMIMHGEVIIGDSTIMFCDSTDQWKSQAASLFVYVDNADEAYQKALKEGATTVMELADQDYGRTCGVKDPSGNTWWITSAK